MEDPIDFGPRPLSFLWPTSLRVFALPLQLGQREHRQQRSVIQFFNRFSRDLKIRVEGVMPPPSHNTVKAW
jgi:hypothetical protein